MYDVSVANGHVRHYSDDHTETGVIGVAISHVFCAIKRVAFFFFLSFTFTLNSTSNITRISTMNQPTQQVDVVATLDSIHQLLKDDSKVKVAVVDTDGVLRGKVMHKTKFLQIVDDGFGTF